MQSDYSNIGDACNSWLTLLGSPDLSEDMKSAIKRRMKVAVTPHHILAQMVMNKEGCPIPVQMKEEAQVFLEKIDGLFLGVLATFEIQDTSIFPASAYSADKVCFRSHQILGVHISTDRIRTSNQILSVCH